MKKQLEQNKLEKVIEEKISEDLAGFIVGKSYLLTTLRTKKNSKKQAFIVCRNKIYSALEKFYINSTFHDFYTFKDLPRNRLKN